VSSPYHFWNATPLSVPVKLPVLQFACRMNQILAKWQQKSNSLVHCRNCVNCVIRADSKL